MLTFYFYQTNRLPQFAKIIYVNAYVFVVQILRKAKTRVIVKRFLFVVQNMFSFVISSNRLIAQCIRISCKKLCQAFNVICSFADLSKQFIIHRSIFFQESKQIKIRFPSRGEYTSLR